MKITLQIGRGLGCRCARWALWLVAGGVLAGPNLAAVLPLPGGIAATPAPSEAAERSLESIAERRARLKTEIAATRAQLARLPDTGADEAARWLTEETALLERIDAVHAEQQRTVQRAADLAKETIAIEERTRNRPPVETTLQPPFGLRLLDQLYTEREELAQAAITLKAEVGAAETLLREAHEVLADKARARRAVRQVVDQPAEGGTPSTGNLRLAELEGRHAEESVWLREQGLKALKLELALVAPRQQLLRPRFEWLRAHLDLAPEDLAASAQSDAKRATELERAVIAARKEADKVTQIAIATERRSADGRTPEELESRRADRQTANLTVSVLTAQRERLAEVAKVDGLRRRVLSVGMAAGELRALAKENQEAIDELVRERRREGLELLKSRNELQEWQSRMTRAAAADEKSLPWRVERVKRLAAWIELSAAERADLDRMRTVRSRLQEEIGGQVNLFSWREQVGSLGDSLVAAWNYEVFAVQDAPVRVKTILGVLLLVGLGYHGARWLSALLARTFLRRLGLNVGRRAAWQALGFYGLFFTVLVVAFNLFHVSLTQFSVVSGALAVGIGFGSQNLVGNFISGIILLIERPVNQGDVIEIDGRQVTVERVGPRSTTVRSTDNTHIIVPNSRLLEQPVTNWTLSDEVIRKRISVGVAYESPTRSVVASIQRVLAGLEAVRREPAPIVKFADFGSSALIFEVYFWVNIADWWATETELRHQIAETFAAEKIVLAFPQSDVHLATTTPLQVVIQHGKEVVPGRTE